MLQTDILNIIGASGLLLISAGVLIQNRKKRDILFIAGGFLLEAYSIYIGSEIFIALQIVFIAAASYDLAKLKNR